MRACVTNCLRLFLNDLGYFALLTIVACILLAIASGGLGLPLVVACLEAAGVAYAATAIFGCIGVCV